MVFGRAQDGRRGETAAEAMCGLLSLAMVSQLSINTCLLEVSSVGSVSISWRRFKKARHSGLSSRDPTSFVVFDHWRKKSFPRKIQAKY